MRAEERIIGRYAGKERGPLFICLGGIHGNEPAGTRAISRFFEMIPPTWASLFRGKILGLRGNLQALAKGVRFLEKDLNRIMTPEVAARVRHAPEEELAGEYLELKELLRLIDTEVGDSSPSQLILLDLHTTSADGGVFSIPDGSKESLELALTFHVPVVLGMTGGLDGTSLSFFPPAYMGVPTIAVAFEAGQNDDPVSEHRSIAAMCSVLKATGCLPEEAVENPFEHYLIACSEGLPAISELLYVHPVHPEDGFVMRPGYLNFQKVKKGEHLADDRSGPVYSGMDGRVLMPLYQSKGSNGFFLVRDVD